MLHAECQKMHNCETRLVIRIPLLAFVCVYDLEDQRKLFVFTNKASQRKFSVLKCATRVKKKTIKGRKNVFLIPFHFNSMFFPTQRRS